MSENKHLTPVFIVYADGNRLDVEHEGALKSITINDGLNGIATFSLLFDDAEARVWDKGLLSLESEISIHLGYKDDVEEVFRGEVTGVCGKFPEEGVEQLEVKGSSVLHRLNHAEHCRSYESKKPSEIIKGILEGYSINCEIEDFGASLDFQTEENQTDYIYLINAAKAYGKQVYADGTTVYVKDEITVRKDEIIYEWGKSLIQLETMQDISRLAAAVDFTGWDSLKNSSFNGKVALKDLTVKTGGGKNWTEVSKSGGGQYESSRINPMLKDSEDAKQMAHGQLQNNSFLFSWAKGGGEGNYKLRPGMRVAVKMVGNAFEGEYIAQEVTHRFDRENGYKTDFTLKRNMCL
jgi:phage protein D